MASRKSEIKVFLPDIIGGGYGHFWRSEKRYRVLKGGKGSKKSTTTALNLIYRLMKYPESNLLVVRAVFNTHKDSTFAQLKWAQEKLGVSHLWQNNLNPLEMTYKPTGQKILFRGFDDVLKLASTTVPKGYLCWVWVEEAYEIKSEADFDKLDLSVPRGNVPDGLFKQTTLTFNPWSQEHWLKKRFFDSDDPTIDKYSTNYMVNEFLDDTDKAVFERMKRENPRKYAVAGLGEWGIAEGLIYENWEILDFNPDELGKIPNQIAINRALSASVWHLLLTGMPKTLVNRDLIQQPITNEPGQIINVASGADYDVQRALAYVQPPQFASQFQNFIADLAQSTLTDSGANDAALGDVRPDNASAIIAMREAALQPMQVYQNRFYSAIEELARIWADYWTSNYGNRPLKVVDKQGTRYIPFDGDRYKNLVINAKVDVGASTLWGESVVVSSLGNLLQAGVITPVQYLERLPKGTIPDITGLIEDMQAQAQAQSADRMDVVAKLAQQQPELYEQFKQMSPAEQEQMLQEIGGMQ